MSRAQRYRDPVTERFLVSVDLQEVAKSLTRFDGKPYDEIDAGLMLCGGESGFRAIPGEFGEFYCEGDPTLLLADREIVSIRNTPPNFVAPIQRHHKNEDTRGTLLTQRARAKNRV